MIAMASLITTGGPENGLHNSKQLAELLEKLQENLSKALSKNESLLEAIESSEAKAAQAGNSEAAILRNLRARLAAAHAPNSVLKRDLTTFSGIFEKRYKELENTIQDTFNLKRQLKHENHDLEARIKSYEQERTKFEEERAEWKGDLDQARQEIIEQNDRLAVLSQSLAGTKNELDAKKSELASQRIAFEEEKLTRLEDGGQATDSEAEALRIKLKEQVIRNVELENALLRTELSLHQSEENVRELEQRNDRLQHDVLDQKIASSKTVKQFEKKIAEANKKLAQMNAELIKSQETARRFQDLLTGEKRKQKGLKHALEQELQRKSACAEDNLTPVAQKAYVETLAQSLSNSSKPHGSIKADDVIRKSEAILVENAALKAEIRKLRIENGDLLRRVRFADTNAHYMRNQVITNVADRAELIKRLDKAEAQYQELKQSLAKQANEWVSLKRKESKADKTMKWSQIEPIPVLGASERTWSCPPGKSHSLSRSIQFQRW